MIESGLVGVSYPVQCAWCKRVRVDGFWVVKSVDPFDEYSHGICPSCEKNVKREIRKTKKPYH